MKKIDVAPSRIKVDDELLKTLLTEIKETLATDISLAEAAPRKFTTASLWKIRRNGRTAVEMFKG